MRSPLLQSVPALLCVAGISSAQVPTWKPELLGTPGASWSSLTWPTGVNDAGVVVGNTYVAGWKHGWVASPDLELQTLPLPVDGVTSEVLDINSSGVAVGQVGLSTGVYRAIVWEPTGEGYDFLLLPPGPGGWTPFNARGINDRGDVVGKYGFLPGSYYWNEAEGVVQLTTAVFPTVPEDVNEQRQVVGGVYRMDLDTLVVETLGHPTGLTFGLLSTVLSRINDAGECVGYSTATTSSNYKFLPVRYTDGLVEPDWTVFSSKQLSAGAVSISASGDTIFHLGVVGNFVSVGGVGSIELQNTLDPAHADWDLTDSFVPVISRGGRVAATGADSSGQVGVILLSPSAFGNLGGASRGALGDPVLDGFGELVPGTPTRLRIASAAPNSVAVLGWSSSSVPIKLFGGTLVASPLDLFVALPTDFLGRAEVTFNWPAVPAGTAFYQQAAVIDGEAQVGVALSNGLRCISN